MISTDNGKRYIDNFLHELPNCIDSFGDPNDPNKLFVNNNNEPKIYFNTKTFDLMSLIIRYKFRHDVNYNGILGWKRIEEDIDTFNIRQDTLRTWAMAQHIGRMK